MKTFEENIISRLQLLDREVERLRVGEKAIGGSGGVTDHGALTGLEDDDHPQYLLTTGKAADSDKLDGNDSTAFATAGHLHDDRYSLLGHPHDDRYYTEVEIDNLLLGTVDKNITLTAGLGLKGGGDLSTNRRFVVGAGNGISVGEDNVSVDLYYNFTWLGVH